MAHHSYIIVIGNEKGGSAYANPPFIIPKLIEKTIHLAHKLTKTFLTQNIESYTQT